MTFKVIAQRADNKFEERFQWKTNVISTVTNNEDRVSVIDYPEEYVTFSVTTTDEEQVEFIESYGDFTKLVSDVLSAKDEVTVPIFSMEGTMSAPAWTSGTRQLTTSVGDDCFITKNTEYVMVAHSTGNRKAQVVSWSDTSRTLVIDFGLDTGLTVSGFSRVIPLRDGLVTKTNLTWSNYGNVEGIELEVRLTRNGSRTEQFTGTPIGAFGTYQGRPVVFDRAIQGGFNLSVDQGTKQVQGDAGFPAYRSLWATQSFSGSCSYTFDRYFNRISRWRKLFDTIIGSFGTFWTPISTFKLEPVSKMGNGAVVVSGTGYYEFWQASQLRYVAINNEQIFEVIGVEVDANSDTVLILSGTYTPAITEVAIAALVRLSDDSVTMKHQGRMTTVDISVVTVQTATNPQSILDPLIDVSCESEGVTIGSGKISQIINYGTLGGDFRETTLANQPTLSYWGSAKSALMGDAYASLTSNLAGGSLSFLAGSSSYTLVMNFEPQSASAVNKYLLKSSNADFYIRLDGTTNQLRVVRAGRTITTVGAIAVGSRNVLMLVVMEGQPDRLYLNNVLVGQSLTTTPNGVITEPVSVGSETASGSANSRVGFLLVLPQALTMAQRGFVDSLARSVWVDPSPLKFQWDGSDQRATILNDDVNAPFGYFTSVPCSGDSASGPMIPVGADEPNVMIVGQLNGLSFNGSEQTSLPLLSTNWLYNNSTDYQLSFALRLGASPTSVVLFSAGSASDGLEVTFSGSSLTFTFKGGTNVSRSVAMPGYGVSGPTAFDYVVEIRFKSGASPTIQFGVDGVWFAEQSATHTWGAGASTPTVSFGNGSGYGLCEFIGRTDHVSQSDYLREKWFSAKWDDSITDDDDYVITDLDGYTITN